MKILTVDNAEQLGKYKANYSVFDSLFNYAQKLLNVSKNYIKIYYAPQLGYFSPGLDLDTYNSIIGNPNNVNELYYDLVGETDGNYLALKTGETNLFNQQNNIVFLNYTFPALGLFNIQLSNSILYQGCIIEYINNDYFITNLITNEKQNQYIKDVNLLHQILLYEKLPFNPKGDSPFILWGRYHSRANRKLWYLLLPDCRANEVDPRLYSSKMISNSEAYKNFVPYSSEIPAFNSDGSLDLINVGQCYLKGIPQSSDIGKLLYTEYFNTFLSDYIIDDIAFQNFKGSTNDLGYELKTLSTDDEALLKLSEYITDATSEQRNNFVSIAQELNYNNMYLYTFHWFNVTSKDRIAYTYFGHDLAINFSTMTQENIQRLATGFLIEMEAMTLHRVVANHWFEFYGWRANVGEAEAGQFYQAIDNFIGATGHGYDYKDFNYPIAVDAWDWANYRCLITINLGYLTADFKPFSYWLDLETWRFVSDVQGNAVGNTPNAALDLLWDIINKNRNNITADQLAEIEAGVTYSMIPSPLPPISTPEPTLIEPTPEPVTPIPESKFIQHGETLGTIFQREWFILLLILFFIYLLLKERR